MTVCLHITLPVRVNNFLPVAHSPVPVLHIEADAHSLIHHMQHVDVGVCKNGSHFLQTKLTHLQQLTGRCKGVKEQC